MQDVLSAIAELSERVDTRIEKSENDVLEAIGVFAEQVDRRFEGIEGRLTRVEATMVTKSYLDDKLADQKGAIVLMMRKEDQKVNHLVDVMARKRLLSNSETKEVLSFKLFP